MKDYYFMPIFRREHIQGTEKRILETARRLFSDYSYLGVSMSDIAKKLNITKAALYYHFSGKDEIYMKVLDRVFNNLCSSITKALNEKTVEKKLEKLIKNYLEFGLREKNFVKALMLKLSPSDPLIKKHIIQLRKETTNLTQPLVKEMIVRKKLSQRADSRLITSLLTGMMNGLLLEYSFLNKKIDPEKMSSQIIKILFNTT